MDDKDLGPFGCKCKTLHHRVCGDGCEICNPELAEEIRKQNLECELLDTEEDQ